MVDEKLWAQAYDRSLADGSKTQTEHYRILLGVPSAAPVVTQDCIRLGHSSRICELGTKTCVVEHAVVSQSEGTRVLPAEFYAPVSKERAHLALTRYINLQFDKDGERPTARIPATPDDDDLLLSRFIEQSASSTPVVSGQAETFWNILTRLRQLGMFDAIPDKDRFYAAWESAKTIPAPPSLPKAGETE